MAFHVACRILECRRDHDADAPVGGALGQDEPAVGLRPADVGHILETLKSIGRQHAIVVETDTAGGGEVVRGIFSATNIGRRLGVPIQTFEVARTFADIEAALASG